MITITPIYQADGDRHYRHFFDQKLASQRLDLGTLWQGEGAKILCLKNPVTLNTFQNLLQGRSANGEKQLRNQSARPEVLGWRLTITAPQDLSVLWALAPRQTRTQFQHAHISAAHDALYLFQAQRCNWHGHLVETDLPEPGLIIASFTNGTGVNRSPQLRATAFAFNMEVKHDGKIRALTNDTLCDCATELESNYRIRLDDERRGINYPAIPKELVREMRFSNPLDEAKIFRSPQGTELFAEWNRQSKEWGWDPADHFGPKGQRKREFLKIAEKLRSELRRGRDFLRRSRESLPELFHARLAALSQRLVRLGTRSVRGFASSRQRQQRFQKFQNWSGKGAALPPLPPLKTGHEGMWSSHLQRLSGTEARNSCFVHPLHPWTESRDSTSR